MKTLHLYLTRQVLLSLLMTVAVFTFVLLLGNVLKEILALLVSRQITIGLMLKAIGLLIPYVMAYVLPFGMLTSTLLVFGRFSADHELTAVRASGISLITLVTPVLLLGMLLAVLCAAFNLWIAPQCRSVYKNMIFQRAMQSPGSLIIEDRFIDEIPGIVLYVRRKNGDNLEDVRLYSFQNGQIVSRTHAKSGEVIWDATGKKISFRLHDSVTEVRNQKDPEADANFIGPRPPEEPSEWLPIQMPGSFETDPPIDLSPLFEGERKPKLSEMNFHQLLAERRDLERNGISSMPVRVELNRQVSFSFACFAFTLIGIPLAIRAHRRETSVGVAIAIGLLLVYYTFFIVGDALETKEYLHPDLIVWVPNFIFQGLGALLLWRANSKI